MRACLLSMRRAREMGPPIQIRSHACIAPAGYPPVQAPRTRSPSEVLLVPLAGSASRLQRPAPAGLLLTRELLALAPSLLECHSDTHETTLLSMKTVLSKWSLQESTKGRSFSEDGTFTHRPSRRPWRALHATPLPSIPIQAFYGNAERVPEGCHARLDEPGLLGRACL